MIHIADRDTDVTFAEEFAKSRGQPLVVGGQSLVLMFRRSVLAGTKVRLTWRSARTLPVQGIRVKLASGALRVSGSDLEDVVLWRDTAPDETVLICHSRHATEIRIWNCWRDDRGVMQAWVGNSAMRVVEVTQNCFSVACNSRQEVTFTDLVFDVQFEPA